MRTAPFPYRWTLILAISICGLVHQAAAADPGTGAPSLFILSDSTARNSGPGKNGQPMAGWGTPFSDYFNPARVSVRNVAHAGQSSRTYFNHPDDWPKILPDIKAGDFVLISFGMNDGGPPYMYSSRGSIPGIDGETKELTRPDGTKETAHTFGWYLATMATLARDQGAHVYFLTVTTRNIWTNPKAQFKDATPVRALPADYNPKDDRIERGTADGQFTDWTKTLGRKMGVPVLDLTNLCADHYEMLGRDAVNALFSDHNQTNERGADVVAAAIVSGLKAFPRSPFVPLLSAKGAAVPAADAKYAEAN
jgi:lysophospholipase L1-like esterase